MADNVFSITAAIVGAGFASGREIMQFFSQYGSFSWILILFSSIMMMALIYGLTDQIKPLDNNGLPNISRALWLLLYCAVSGGMTAAAGELAALTIPVQHARPLGMVATLTFSLKMSSSMRGISWLGKLLMPGMTAIFLLCMRFEETGRQPAFFSSAAFFHAAGYCGLNAVLAAAVTAQAGKNKIPRERRMIAVCSGLLFGGLLALGNAALLPRVLELREEALPVVVLLRGYGKAGFYLSAFILYLAVATTLIACLRGMQLMLPGNRKDVWAALIAALGALIGFQEIVAQVYPVLGYLCLLSLLIPYFLKQQQTGSNKRYIREKRKERDTNEKMDCTSGSFGLGNYRSYNGRGGGSLGHHRECTGEKQLCMGAGARAMERRT